MSKVSLMIRKQSNVVGLKDRQHRANRQTLERLFTEQAAALRSFLAVRLGSGYDMDDLVQDIFLKLAKIEGLSERVANNRGSFKAYLFTMANNLVYDLKRRQGLQKDYSLQQYELNQQQVEEASPEKILVVSQELLAVKEVILAMPPMWQRVFLLNRVELMTYRQIAERLGVSVKQVEKYMSKALHKIREVARGGQGEGTK